MEIHFEAAENDILKIRLVGRFDVDGTQKIEGPLRTTAPGTPHARVCVDLTGVDYLSSVGLGCLVHTAQDVDRVEGKMVLLNPQPIVAKLLKESGVSMHVRVFDTWPAASAFLERLPRAGGD
ncbi:MAG: anti-sigma factor antagonist [Ignavibacteriae bacterium]|nr:anti-sigma factor antagonist [Ignavibacteriota bacterium]